MVSYPGKRGDTVKIRSIPLCALFAAILALCSWISLPVGQIAFTLQTFGVALTLLVLGGNRGCAAIFVYLALGTLGLPVFSGFRGGPGMLLGATGGYLTGFLAFGLVYWLVCRLLGQTLPVRCLALSAGMLSCYLFGSFWYGFGYAPDAPLSAILAQCVLPYLLFDICKLCLAVLLHRRLGRILEKFSA